MHKLTKFPNFNHLSKMHKDCKAILWDMDGTLLETEHLHTKSTQVILSQEHPEHNLTAEQIDLICYGETDAIILQKFQAKRFLEHINLESFLHLKNTSIKLLILEMKPSELIHSEVLRFLNEAQSKKIRQALVTSSEKETVHNLLSHLKLVDYFELIITREDTTENKPSPTPYLHAIESLGLQVHDIIIFEDSDVGLSAAKDSQAIYCHACWYD